MFKSYKAYAPATLSNLACGFDLLGMAIEGLGDYVFARETDEPGVVIKEIIGPKKGIDLVNNTATKAVQKLLEALNNPKGISMTIQKGYAHSSGLGSSAASAVAAVVASNAVLGKPFKEKQDLFEFAYAGELSQNPELPSDNIAASLYGGIILSHWHDAHERLPSLPGLTAVIVRQPEAITTSEGRKVLSHSVPLKKAISQTHAMASLVLGFYKSDLDLIRLGLNDHMIEEQRKGYVHNFDEIKSLAISKDALGCSISGSGPSIFALFQNTFLAELFHKEVRVLYPKYFTHIGQIDQEGAVIC